MRLALPDGDLRGLWARLPSIALPLISSLRNGLIAIRPVLRQLRVRLATRLDHHLHFHTRHKLLKHQHRNKTPTN